MKRKFIQLYNIRGDWNYPGHKACFLHNGLHYVWDETQPEWMQIRHGAFDEVPDADEIYVTANAFLTLDKAWQWAKKAPDKKIIVGGPVVRTHENLLTTEPLPENLILYRGMAEELFGRPHDPKTFKLVPPPLPEGCHYTYAFPYRTFCRWGKCLYCTEPHDDGRPWDLEPLWNAPDGSIHISCLSVGPQELEDVSRLPFNNRRYVLAIRADATYLPTLEKIVKYAPPEKMMLKCGIEFPSARMYKYMRKGLTIQSTVDFINGASALGFTVCLAFITHWGVIVQEDLDEAKNFFKAIKNNWSSGESSAHVPFIAYTKLTDVNRDLYEPDPQVVGPFIVGYYLKQSEEQLKLNGQYISILHDAGITRNPGRMPATGILADFVNMRATRPGYLATYGDVSGLNNAVISSPYMVDDSTIVMYFSKDQRADYGTVTNLKQRPYAVLVFSDKDNPRKGVRLYIKLTSMSEDTYEIGKYIENLPPDKRQDADRIKTKCVFTVEKVRPIIDMGQEWAP